MGGFRGMRGFGGRERREERIRSPVGGFGGVRGLSGREGREERGEISGSTCQISKKKSNYQILTHFFRRVYVRYRGKR